MTGEPSGETSGHSESKASQLGLVILAALSTCVYGVVSLLSWQFDFDSATTDRPIIGVLCLFAVAFAAYLIAIRIVWRASAHRHTLKLLVVTAVMFRVVMLFSLPIQEVDVYRYLWDGAVSTAGVSPFRYSPQQVSSAGLAAKGDPSLQRLTKLRDRDPVIAEILSRVHFPELPTIYPPTSQAVFAAANLTTPGQASLLTRLFITKLWFIAFDIATLFVVIALLRVCKRPPSLCVIYAWCPLLMKEVANSGHLDAVAVFIVTLAIYLVARLLVNTANPFRLTGHVIVYMGLIGCALALAVGAKLYPVVLAPLFFLAIARKFGWRIALIPATAFVVLTVALLSPVFLGEKTNPGTQQHSDASLGVVTFLQRWQMNDYIFLLVIENLKPTADRGPDETAWFTVMPEPARDSMVEFVSSRFGIASAEVPFLMARALTAITFFIAAMVIAYRTSARGVSGFCEGSFLTLAWFWLLCPTQNPWYWTWALPLLPFARGRMWLAVSGLVFVYYLRFWLNYHFAETQVLDTPYMGTVFFDFVMTWVEFAPWFGLLAIGFMLQCKKIKHFDMPSYQSQSK